MIKACDNSMYNEEEENSYLNEYCDMQQLMEWEKWQL